MRDAEKTIVNLVDKQGVSFIASTDSDGFRAMNINLREWRIEDAPDLVAAINNKNVLDNLRDGIPYPYTEKDAKEFITAMRSADKNAQYAFAIIYDGKVIGSIGVFRKDNVHRQTGELGYYIAEPYWGKGITTEAVRQIRDYVFENTDIVRVFAEPYAHNEASCRVLEKAGFQFEGLLRQNAIKNGQHMDMKMYAVLKPPSMRPLDSERIALYTDGIRANKANSKARKRVNGD